MSQSKGKPPAATEATVISHDEIKAALTTSGYLLEHRVEQILVDSKKNYSVEASPVFTDRITGKLREIDLLARSFLHLNASGDGNLWPVLLIECVNNTQPLGFITKPAGRSPLEIYDAKIAGIPTKLIEDDHRRILDYGDGYHFLLDCVSDQNWHYYSGGRYATQYFTFAQKKDRGKDNQWYAWHDNDHHDHFNKLVDATDELINYLYRAYVQGDEDPINIELYYPVLVVGGSLIDVRQDNQAITVQNAEHIMYRRPSVQAGESTITVIDVVTEAFFPKYLDIVEKEVHQLAKAMGEQLDRVDRSSKKLAQEYKSLQEKSIDHVRKHFSF